MTPMLGTPSPAVAPNTPSLIDALRAQARAAPDSGIVEVMNYGRAREDVIPLWAGEGDMPTPAFIAEAATRLVARSAAKHAAPYQPQVRQGQIPGRWAYR